MLYIIRTCLSNRARFYTQICQIAPKPQTCTHCLAQKTIRVPTGLKESVSVFYHCAKTSWNFYTGKWILYRKGSFWLILAQFQRSGSWCVS